MLRHERRLLGACLLVGAVLTALVIALDAAGALRPLEDALYDVRCRLCQHFVRPPTDRLVQLDIDDASQETIGRWPWPRGVLARILDEVRLAGPKAVELDLLLTDPQKIEYVPTSMPAAAPTIYHRIDNDAELSQAIKRLGNVILPTTFKPMAHPSPLYAAMVKALTADPELDPDATAAQLRKQGTHVPSSGLGDAFYAARRDAIDARLRALNPPPDTTLASLRAALLPHTPANVESGLTQVLSEQWEKYQAVRAFARFALPAPVGMTGGAGAQVHVALAPIPQFSNAAASGAFVDYPQFGSPIIRALPLLLEHQGHVYPQMGLRLACRMFDADMTRMRLQRRAAGAADLVIPRAAGAPALVIPLAGARTSSDGVTYRHLFDIPWIGSSDWQTMYDWPRHRSNARHLPINSVWSACVTRDRIERNNRVLDDAVRGILEAFGEIPRRDAYTAAIKSPDDFASRARQARAVLEEYRPFYQQAAHLPPDKLRPEDRVFLASFAAIEQTLPLTTKLSSELNDQRALLAQEMKDKAVLIGWTATAAVADFVPTSLHQRCPGVVVHGAIFNAIVSGEMWRTIPWWVSAMCAAALGLLTALIVARFQPLGALLLALLLACLFAFIDGTVLFDYANRILPAAAPLCAIGLAWSGCTLTRVVVEAAERQRITGRFRSYVDPKLVNYVLENPDVRFDGETREMTVVFTDLAGFTALSEKLGEKIVPVLNELLGELVPVIRDHHGGYVNKFLGDGIMFFYNAPVRTPTHAADAVATVLDMRAALERYNLRLRERGLPELSMRAGIVTGEMVVGDAGGARQNDYTVLGDAVNLAARLEPANKSLGTHTLINDRTAKLLDGQFLLRPVGRIKVVGRDESVEAYEPLAVASAATDHQREFVGLWTDALALLRDRQFADCLPTLDRIASSGCDSRLIDLYRAMCHAQLDHASDEKFDATIVLTQK